jgi:hypothetical protein
MIRILAVAAVLALVCRAADPEDPVSIYKSGDYRHAIPRLEAAVQANPKDPVLHAALLSSLVYEGEVDKAADAADADETAFPQSPEVLAARGEFAFYMGDMPAAEALFKAAIKLNSSNARATYGLARLFRAASMYRTARLLYLSAHQMDPDDALITAAFINYLVPQKRKEVLPQFRHDHPWFYGHAEQAESTESAVEGEVHERKIFELDGPKQEVTLPLVYLHNGLAIRGIGIRISIGDSKPLTIVLDTGASGLLLTQAVIDNAGLNHLGSFDVWGIGDAGAKSAFIAVADHCMIGTLRYKTCAFQAISGKKRISDEADGLIGTDFFSGYLMTIDFQRRTLHLVPLPDRAPNPQGYDRSPLPNEAGFTPVFRFGHHLYVTTKVNQKVTGLFLIDTGAGLSNIDSTLARLTTKIHTNEYVTVKGVSGKVKDVFEADKAELTFGRFRQRNLGLIAFNLNNSGEHQEVRMGGLLGFPVLILFRLSLDYRNGLVDFDYVLDSKKK